MSPDPSQLTIRSVPRSGNFGSDMIWDYNYWFERKAFNLQKNLACSLRAAGIVLAKRTCANNF